MGARQQGGRRPHLSSHVGAVSIEVVVLPIEGDVVAAPVDGTGAVAQGLGAGPAPSLAGAAERGRGVWSLPPHPTQRATGPSPRGTVRTAPQAGHLRALASPKAPSSTRIRARALRAEWGGAPALPLSAGGRGRPGRATHQVLQSTLISSPGAYRSLLCTHGHSCSTTQPPRPSSTSPSGHTQPLTHSVWYWGQPESGGQGLGARPAPPRCSSDTETPLTSPPTSTSLLGQGGR